MDGRDRPLSPSSDGMINFPINDVFIVLIAVLVIFITPFVLFRALQEIGKVKFSMEPVVYTGLDLDGASLAVPPSFNVTLCAKSTYGLIKLCTSGRPAMEVSYSGTTIAMADVEPFCLEPREEKIITATATASPGWPVLPVVLQELMESDRRHGGVHVEVDFNFEDEQAARWVRCRTTLDDKKASRCNVYITYSSISL